jgi:hypothetical protein
MTPLKKGQLREEDRYMSDPVDVVSTSAVWEPAGFSSLPPS